MEETMETVAKVATNLNLDLNHNNNNFNDNGYTNFNSNSNNDWQKDILHKWHVWHTSMVTTGEKWLDHAASIELTNPSPKHVSWTEELGEFQSFVSLPALESYSSAIVSAFHDGVQGAKSVGYAFWMLVQPILYSFSYLGWRLAQATFGKLLPTIQYAMVESCRFHLHLTWRQALGELMFFVLILASWKLYRHLQRKAYIRRTRQYLKKQTNKVTKSVQSAYREIAQISVLFAMAIPHIAYVGAIVAFKLVRPSWVTWIATESMAPFVIKWLYPVAATVVILHHARGFHSVVGEDIDIDIDMSMEEEDDNDNTLKKGIDAPTKEASPIKRILKPVANKLVRKKPPSKDETKEEAKLRKKKNRRRRSSIGALFTKTAPGAINESGQISAYTDEEIHEDINYWLHFWLLRASLLVVHTLFSFFFVVGSFLQEGTVANSILCQVDLLFFIWIFMLPECLLTLYPTAGEQEKRDWSPGKQLAYEIALRPVLAIPKLFKPIIIPIFEKVSQVIPARWWKRVVTDQVRTLGSGLVMIKVLSETTKDAMVDFVIHVRTLLVPGALLFMPGFFTQYGCCYVQYIVPLAFSYRALHRESKERHAQRVLYLKFWVLNALAAGVFVVIKRFFGWFPLFTHATFCVWVWLVMPRTIRAIYNEFDRELQAFGLLPPVEAGLSIEKTHTVRALTYLASTLPTASDANSIGAAKETNDREATPASVKEGPKAKGNTGTLDDKPVVEKLASVKNDKDKDTENVVNDSSTSSKPSSLRQKA